MDRTDLGPLGTKLQSTLNTVMGGKNDLDATLSQLDSGADGPEQTSDAYKAVVALRENGLTPDVLTQIQGVVDELSPGV